MHLKLNALKRQQGTRGELTELRVSGKIPGVVYGHGKETTLVAVSHREFEKLYGQAGTSTVVDLLLDGSGATLPVLISEIQRDPTTDKVTHIDLHQIRLDEKLRTEIALHFIGESPAVKSLGGNLIINTDKLNVECLPQDLVSSIEVDISTLANLDDSLHIGDLRIPAGITVLDDVQGSVVSVLAPRAEEEKPTPATEVVGADAVASETPDAAAPTVEAKPAEVPKK